MTKELDKAIETYRREFPRLKNQAGQYVLIRGSDVLSTWNTYEDAIKAGYLACELEPFFVKKIELIESVQFYSRNVESVALCRS